MKSIISFKNDRMRPTVAAVALIGAVINASVMTRAGFWAAGGPAAAVWYLSPFILFLFVSSRIRSSITIVVAAILMLGLDWFAIYAVHFRGAPGFKFAVFKIVVLLGTLCGFVLGSGLNCLVDFIRRKRCGSAGTPGSD